MRNEDLQEWALGCWVDDNGEPVPCNDLEPLQRMAVGLCNMIILDMMEE